MHRQLGNSPIGRASPDFLDRLRPRHRTTVHSDAGIPRATAKTIRLRRGTACVEFAVILPVLLTLVLGILEIGRYVEVRQVLTAAVREGARQASTGQMTNSQVVDVVTGAMKSAGLPTTNLAVTVTDLTNPGTDVKNATTLDDIQVTASLPMTDVRYCSAVMWTDATSRISATTIWCSSNPQSYPTDVTAPVGN